MNSFLLKSSIVILLFAMNSICAFAQTSKFIYLQSENKEEFYVKLDKKVLNSSPAGYLIIPKLSDNTYPLTIGFYDAGMPEISTIVKIRDANLGFLLKNSADKGWALLNLQTMQPLAIKKEFPSGREEKAGPDIDEFSRILAEVVNEPSIAWAPVVKPDDIVVMQPVIKTAEKKIPVSPKIDTVQQKKPAAPVVEGKKVVKTKSKPSEQKTSGTPQVDSVMEKKSASPSLITITNANCKKTATENEYLKLRKQMAGEANEKNMIKAANKQFLNTCYSTEQVKNLSVLFVNEEEKYKFFVAAYPHVSDTNNFGILKDLLTDNYYKTRLDAMVNH